MNLIKFNREGEKEEDNVKRVLLLLVVLTLPSCLFGSTVLLQSGTPTASTSAPLAPGFTFPPGPGGTVGGLDPAFGIGNPITVVNPDPFLIIAVQDCCLVGDVYEVIVNGSSKGLTAIVPLGGPTLSTGVFEVAATGTVNVSINDVLLSYIGAADPFGGGVVPAIYNPAGLSEQIFGTTVSPEPGTLMLFGSGLLMFGSKLKKKLLG